MQASQRASWNHALELAIEQAPDQPEAYYALGAAYAQGGNQAQACETYDHFLALELSPTWRTQAEQDMAQWGCP